MSEGRNPVAELEAKMDGKDREIERLRRQVSLLNGHDTLAQLEAHIDEQAAEIERLRAENFELAAHQCPHSYGDERGNQVCAEIDRIRAALREIANMDDPAISAQQVAADALEGKE